MDTDIHGCHQHGHCLTWLRSHYIVPFHVNHCFKTRLGPAGRTVNRWVGRFEPTFGSVMQLTRPEPVKTGDSAEFLV